MSDQWGPGDGDAVNPWARPDGPEAAPRGVEPPLTLETEQHVQTRSGGIGGRAVAGIIGVLILLGGTVFAVTQIGSSGPGSAEDAVRELLDAASDEDILGVLASLDPGERDALRAPVEDLFAELERLEVLDPSFELGGVPGLDVEFDDVQLRSTPVRDDLVRVYFTGGTVTTGINGDEVPLGDFVEDTMERFGGDLSGVDESDTEDLASEDTFLVARNGPDGWRVSIGYTLAEVARVDAGLPLPASGIAPVGADSPEAAVEGMFQAIADLDLRGAISRLSPNELGALQDYATLFIDDAEAAIGDATSDVAVTIDDLTLRADESGDRASVFVETFGVTVTHEGESVSISTDGECLTVSGPLVDDELEGTPFTDGPVCADDMSALYGDMIEESGLEESEIELPEFPVLDTPEVGITTAMVDGDWYVAPASTYLDGMVSVLRVLERSHLDAFVDFVEDWFFGFGLGFGSEETFSEIGESLEGEYGELLPEDGSFEAYPGEDGYTTETTFEPGTGVVDQQVLEEIATALSTDAAGMQCLLKALRLYDDGLLFELTDSWVHDYEPSPEAQDALYSSLDTCSAGTG